MCSPRVHWEKWCTIAARGRPLYGIWRFLQQASTLGSVESVDVRRAAGLAPNFWYLPYAWLDRRALTHSHTKTPKAKTRNNVRNLHEKNGDSAVNSTPPPRSSFPARGARQCAPEASALSNRPQIAPHTLLEKEMKTKTGAKTRDGGTGLDRLARRGRQHASAL